MLQCDAYKHKKLEVTNFGVLANSGKLEVTNLAGPVNLGKLEVTNFAGPRNLRKPEATTFQADGPVPAQRCAQRPLDTLARPPAQLVRNVPRNVVPGI